MFLNRSLVRYLAIPVVAMVANSPATAGNLEGRVTDASSGRYLPGVSISLSGAGRQAVTDEEGQFSIANLSAGEYTVAANYIGYDTGIERVNVPETGVAMASFSLGSEVVELEGFTVEGFRESRTLGLQQKRSAENIRDVISADSVGSLPDRNVAEALARVPGVSLEVDSGEGRFVSIRGIEPSYNNVTLDGSTVAAPSVGGRSGRSVPLDVVGSGQISQIEVIKSVTPDMDANALGGTINIKSASAFARPEAFVFGKFELGDNSAADGTLIDTDITWGRQFNEGKLGIALSANYSNRPYVAHEVDGDWNDTDEGQFYLENYEVDPQEGERTRKGINYNIEFRPNDDTEFYLRGIYNEFKQDESQQEFRIEARGDPTFASPTLIEYSSMRFEYRDFNREIDQTLINVSTGMSKRLGNLTIEGDLTYSFSEEDVPFIRSVQFRTGNESSPFDEGLPFQFDQGSFYPAYNDQGFSTNRLEEFPLRRYRDEDSLVQEDTWSPRLDFEWDLHEIFGDRSGTVKTGVKYTNRTRFVDDNSERPVADDLTILDIADLGPGFPTFDDRYRYPLDLDADQAFEFLNANRDLFEVDPIESQSNSIEDDYDVTEEIIALYAMGTLQWSDKLSMILGVRYEQTDANMLAFELQTGEVVDPEDPEDTIDVANVVQNQGTFDYDNILPNLQFRYNLTENSLIRFAFTGTLGRAKYEDASPISTLEYIATEAEGDVPLDPAFPNQGFLEIGNPELSPYESVNFDLAYEYYLRAGGLLSAGLFRKEIDNPIYRFSDTQRNVVYNDIAFETLSRTEFRNADSATVSGLELNVQLPFTTFFRNYSVLDGFGIDANATFISSEVTVFGREGDDLPFFKQPDEIYNFALYYQKYGFQARLAYNYQSERLDELRGDADLDYWDAPREFTDFQASYQLSENFTIYANWQNIFEAPDERTVGQKTRRIRASEFFGSYVRAGVRFNF